MGDRNCEFSIFFEIFEMRFFFEKVRLRIRSKPRCRIGLRCLLSPYKISADSIGYVWLKIAFPHFAAGFSRNFEGIARSVVTAARRKFGGLEALLKKPISFHKSEFKKYQTTAQRSDFWGGHVEMFREQGSGEILEKFVPGES